MSLQLLFTFTPVVAMKTGVSTFPIMFRDYVSFKIAMLMGLIVTSRAFKFKLPSRALVLHHVAVQILFLITTIVTL